MKQTIRATDEAYIMRDVEDPNRVTINLGWNDLEKARSFSLSASLKAAMRDAGVTGPPEARFFGGGPLNRSFANDDVAHQQPINLALLVGRLISRYAGPSGRTGAWLYVSPHMLLPGVVEDTQGRSCPSTRSNLGDRTSAVSAAVRQAVPNLT